MIDKTKNMDVDDLGETASRPLYRLAAQALCELRLGEVQSALGSSSMSFLCFTTGAAVVFLSLWLQCISGVDPEDTKKKRISSGPFQNRTTGQLDHVHPQ